MAPHRVSAIAAKCIKGWIKRLMTVDSAFHLPPARTRLLVVVVRRALMGKHFYTKLEL